MRARLVAVLALVLVFVVMSGLVARRERPGDAVLESCALLRDPDGALTAGAAAASDRWRPTTTTPNFGWTRDVVWLRLQLRNGAPRDLDVVLEAAREWVEEVDLYVLDGSRVRSEQRSGARLPLAARPIPFERIVFPLALARGETQTLLVRMHSRSPIAFAGRVLERRAFDADYLTEELLYGAYYGVLVGLAAYSLVLFWMLRDPTQLLVGLFLFSFMLGENASHGHLSRFLPRLAGWLELGAGAAAFGAAAVSNLLLAARMVGERPLLRRLFRATAWIVAVASTSAVLVPALHVVAFASFVLFGVVLMTTVVVTQEDDRQQFFFSTAVGALVVPVTIQIIHFFGFIAVWPENANHLGCVLMAILFALLVGHTLRDQNGRISSLNEELRRQIGERARQLADALARLPAAAALDVGALVGERYRIRARLGAGGMGTVFEVERATDGQRLALKVLKGVSDREALARFAREAQLMAELNHPNIVSVVDVDVSQSGSLYFVMELVRGGTLLAQRDRWGDVAWARPILRQIAEALAAMHARGIVHRDLKPANVLVDGGRVKVSDFGIARLGRDDGDSTVTQDLTRTGAFLGTPRYAAPELSKGAREAQPASDIWSFGVLAEELLGDAAGKDAALRALVASCLGAEPASRPSAAALVDALA